MHGGSTTILKHDYSYKSLRDVTNNRSSIKLKSILFTYQPLNTLRQIHFLINCGFSEFPHCCNRAAPFSQGIVTSQGIAKMIFTSGFNKANNNVPFCR